MLHNDDDNVKSIDDLLYVKFSLNKEANSK